MQRHRNGEGGVTRGAREGGEPGAISSGSQSEGLERLAEEFKVLIGGLGVIDGS